MAQTLSETDVLANQKMILQKVDVNAPQVDGATALHWAVYRQDSELAGAGARKVGQLEFLVACHGFPASQTVMLQCRNQGWPPAIHTMPA